MRSDCCERAANGHVMAEPAITVMKSRRRIAFPKAGTTPIKTRLQQGFAIDEMGFGLGVSLQSSNLGSLMSALPPKADIAERCGHVRFVPKVGHPLPVGTFSSCGTKPITFRP